MLLLVMWFLLLRPRFNLCRTWGRQFILKCHLRVVFGNVAVVTEEVVAVVVFTHFVDIVVYVPIVIIASVVAVVMI